MAVLQKHLARLGHDPRGIDGAFGPDTRKAVISFQRAAKLPVTGVADARTQGEAARRVRALEAKAFVAATTPATTRLAAVQRQVDSFTGDGVVTRGERQTLLASITRAEAAAAPLVAGQSNPVLAALARVEVMTKKGTLTSRAEAAVKQLEQARRGLVARARADAAKRVLPAGFAQPFPGVATKRLVVDGLVANVVAVDLAHPRVRLQTNGEASRGRTVERHARAADAEVAINGDFFSWSGLKPSGLAVTNGKQWTGTSSGFEGFLAFHGRHAALMTPRSKNPEWSRNAVSARPTVLVNGKLTLSDPAKNERTSRTGIGLSKDGRVAYFVAVEGRSGSRGLTASGLGRFLRSLGADDGLAMDSGGSAQLYVKGRGLVHRSTDPGGARGVANVVMVQAG